MTGEQIIIAANGVAYVILWFFVRMWINDVKKSIELIFEKLDGKVSTTSCRMEMTAMNTTNETVHDGIEEDVKRIESLGKHHRHDKETGEVVIIA